jgi:L-lactate utilization protein LutC
MDRLEFVARLARSLDAGGAKAVPVDAAEPPGTSAPGAPLGDLVQRFVERASAAGATVELTQTERQAEAAVEQLALERDWRRLVYPPGTPTPGDIGGHSDPQHADFGLVVADWAVAATGSVLTLSGPNDDRRHSLLPPATGFLVFADHILRTIGDALRLLEREPCGPPSCCTFITGPSSTADIAGNHVVGVHGPSEVLIWVIAETAEPSAHPVDRFERCDPE